MAVYVFARTVDDVGDEAPVAERQRLLAELEADLRWLYGGPASDGRPMAQAVRGLERTVAECAIPVQPFLDLIEANRQDQVISRYQSAGRAVGFRLHGTAAS